jgi:hypothetical protein
LVVDEAHVLKNPSGMVQIIDRFSTNTACFYGTPVQNSPKELMSLLFPDAIILREDCCATMIKMMEVQACFSTLSIEGGGRLHRQNCLQETQTALPHSSSEEQGRLK